MLPEDIVNLKQREGKNGKWEHSVHHPGIIGAMPLYLCQSIPVLQPFPRSAGHLMHCSCWQNMMFCCPWEWNNYTGTNHEPYSCLDYSYGKKGHNWKAIHVVEIVCYNSGSHLSLNCGENIWGWGSWGIARLSRSPNPILCRLFLLSIAVIVCIGFQVQGSKDRNGHLILH